MRAKDRIRAVIDRMRPGRGKPRVYRQSAGAVSRPIDRTRADCTLRGNECIYAAVSRISNTVASMPVHLYRGWELQSDDPRELLFSREPNANFTPFCFMQTMEAFRNTEGNAYALIIRDENGQVDHLDIIDPTKVKPQRDTETKELWYMVMLDSEYWPVPHSELVALHHMSSNGEVGIRPIDVLKGTLDYGAQVRELSLRQLDGVNHGIFLTVPNTGLDEAAREQVIDDFLAAYQKSGQRVVVLEGGLQATTFSQTAVDAQLLDTERITRNRVATVYNIPPHMLGDYTDTSFSTAEQQMQEFLQLTILPIVNQWEQELNRKLLTDEEYAEGYRFRFDVDALCRADTTAMANKYQMAIRSGWMVPNDVREREGLPPDPNGWKLMCSRDVIPMEIAVQHPELLLGGSKQPEPEGGDRR